MITYDTNFIEFTYHIHLYFICDVNITGGVGSIEGFVGGFICFRYCGYL